MEDLLPGGSVILIVLLPLAGYWKGQETLRQTFSDMVVEAPLGARTKLYLPDGTLVWLNAGSKSPIRRDLAWTTVSLVWKEKVILR